MEKSFFNHFFGVIFEAGNETRQNFGVILVLNKREERSEKRVVFVHTAVLEVVRIRGVKFFVHLRLLIAVFLQLLMFMRFDYDIALVSALF